MQKASIRFARKTYGRGRTPVTWQGWGVTLLYVLCIIILSFCCLGTENEPPTQKMTLTFVVGMIVCTALLLLVCYKKGEFPRRQRGEKK